MSLDTLLDTFNRLSLDGSSPTRGERLVAQCLDRLNYRYTTEYSPPWAYRRRYDFYLPKKNLIIEFDGIQHFEYNPSWDFSRTAVELQRTQDIDMVKTLRAINKGKKVLRIHYSFLDLDNLGQQKRRLQKCITALIAHPTAEICYYSPRQNYYVPLHQRIKSTGYNKRYLWYRKRDK